MILAIWNSHDRTDSFLIMLIAIKWSVMTTDNPHMQLRTLDSLGGCCLLMHHWNLKHIQMCVCGTKPQTQSWSPCHCFSACSCLIFTGLAYGNVWADVQSKPHHPHPRIQHIFFPPLQLRSVKGQTVSAVMVVWTRRAGGGVTALWGR